MALCGGGRDRGKNDQPIRELPGREELMGRLLETGGEETRENMGWERVRETKRTEGWGEKACRVGRVECCLC